MSDKRSAAPIIIIVASVLVVFTIIGCGGVMLLGFLAFKEEVRPSPPIPMTFESESEPVIDMHGATEEAE